MDPYILDWLNLLLRWAHVVAVIAWIGSSFYFVFLDNSLIPPTDQGLKAKGVGGELWAVHGGGFYNPQKYTLAPPAIPERLHWFYWESYFTWMTGFALFVALYLFQAETFLIDKSVHDWSAPAAITLALALLLLFWVVYDFICRSFGEGHNGDRIVGIGIPVAVLVATWITTHLFAGRAAFLLAGAMLATAMTANVAMWIIPGQRKVIAQMRAGLPVDPIHGRRGKQRSVHNTYLTLPVLVAMLSNHYAFLYSAKLNWLVLALLMAAGALIRHSFVARHVARRVGQPTPWGYAIAGSVLIAGVAVWLAPVRNRENGTDASAVSTPPTFVAVQAVIGQRCLMCHNASVMNKNVRLDSPDAISARAQQIYQQAVVQKTMPLNNATQMTDAERALIGRWFKTGAPLR